MLAVTLFLSMFTLSVAAAVIGFAVPYLSYIAKIDPALTSGPVVTLIKDATSLLIYFAVATVVYFHYIGV